MKVAEVYWTYRASEPTPEHSDVYPHAFSGTEREWSQLSPGMRREIYRQANKERGRAMKYTVDVVVTDNPYLAGAWPRDFVICVNGRERASGSANGRDKLIVSY